MIYNMLFQFFLFIVYLFVYQSSCLNILFVIVANGCTKIGICLDITSFRRINFAMFVLLPIF